MARIDRLLDALAKLGGEAIVITTGRPANFVVGGTLRPVSTVPASTDDIEALIDEIAPPSAAIGLTRQQAAEFSYRSPEGVAVSIHAERRDGHMFVRVRVPNESPKASPAAALEAAQPESAEPVDDEPLAAPRVPPVDGPAIEDLDLGLPDVPAVSRARVEATPVRESVPGALSIDQVDEIELDLPDKARSAPKAAASAAPPEGNYLSLDEGDAGEVELDLPADRPPRGSRPAEETAPPAKPAAVPPTRSARPAATPASAPPQMIQLDAGGLPRDLPTFLGLLVRLGASDLHLAPGSPPRFRVCGDLLPTNLHPLLAAETAKLAESLLAADERARFGAQHWVTFSGQAAKLGRFRVTVSTERRGLSLAVRPIPERIPSFAELGLPEAASGLAKRPNGLVLVTGPAGSGRSTTAAAIADRINETWRGHLVTLEDPIEHVFQPKSCLVTQRDVSVQGGRVADCLRAALREAPDAILLGDLGDSDTVEAAFAATEAGALVVATLLSQDTVRSVESLIELFPRRRRTQGRLLVSQWLKGVIHQRLVPGADRKRRFPAYEIFVVDRQCANLIRESEFQALEQAAQRAKGQGPRSLEESLAELVKSGQVALEDAARHAANVDALRAFVEGRGPGGEQPRPADGPGRRAVGKN